MAYGLERLLDRITPNRGITANAVWLLSDKLLRMALGLTLGVWMARYLGTARYGQLNYAIAFVALFGPLATLGLEGIVVRELVRHPDRRQLLLCSAFLLRLGGGLVTAVAALSIMLLARPDDSLTLTLVAIIAGGTLFQAFDVIDLWFQSGVRSRYSVLARAGALLGFALVKVVLIVKQAALVWFAVAITGELMVAAAGLVAALLLTGSPVRRFDARLAAMRRLLAESWPLILTGLAIMLYMRIDQVMLGELIGDTEVGLYSAALRLSEVWYVIPTVIIASVMPAVTRAHADSAEQVIQRMKRLFGFLARAAYAVAIPVTFLATPVITLLYGEEFRAAGTILSIHVWAALFVFLGVGITPWILNEGLTRFALLQAVLGAAVNVGLNLLLIPEYGGNGAAVATLISQMTSVYLSLGLTRRTRPMLLLQTRALLLRA